MSDTIAKIIAKTLIQLGFTMLEMMEWYALKKVDLSTLQGLRAAFGDLSNELDQL
jgi:hypothetical protein